MPARKPNCTDAEIHNAHCKDAPAPEPAAEHLGRTTEHDEYGAPRQVGPPEGRRRAGHAVPGAKPHPRGDCHGSDAGANHGSSRQADNAEEMVEGHDGPKYDEGKPRLDIVPRLPRESLHGRSRGAGSQLLRSTARWLLSRKTEWDIARTPPNQTGDQERDRDDARHDGQRAADLT